MPILVIVTALLPETASAAGSLSQKTETQLCDLCEKPQILKGDAPVIITPPPPQPNTHTHTHHSPSSPDLRTTSPHQTHTPQTSTWNYICCIPALFSVLEVSRAACNNSQKLANLNKYAAENKITHCSWQPLGTSWLFLFFVEVHSRVSQYRLIPNENKQVPHCHFPSCTLTPAWHPVSEW